MDITKTYSLDEKLRFYGLARDLFNSGFSYPQVIERLLEAECDKETAKIIAEKAFPEKWDELFNIAKKSIAEGKTYSELVDLLGKHEEDKVIVKFLADTWYEVKTFEVENIIESPTNILEGTQWTLISAVGVVAVFLLNLSLFSKILWSLVFVGAIIQYLLGLAQKKMANKVKKFMNDEQD